MVGWSSTFTGFGGILFQTLGGYLASYHWSYCFFAYLVAVIFLLFSSYFLPEPMQREKLANRKVENQNITHQKVKTPFSVWITGFFLCLFWLFAYVIITNASTVLITEGIAAQSQVGLIFSFMTLGTVISSAFFGKLLEKNGIYHSSTSNDGGGGFNVYCVHGAFYREFYCCNVSIGFQ